MQARSKTRALSLSLLCACSHPWQLPTCEDARAALQESARKCIDRRFREVDPLVGPRTEECFFAPEQDIIDEMSEVDSDLKARVFLWRRGYFSLVDCRTPIHATPTGYRLDVEFGNCCPRTILEHVELKRQGQLEFTTEDLCNSNCMP